MPTYIAAHKGGAMDTKSLEAARDVLRALTGAGTLAIVSIGATATALCDPIFAAITRHKATYQAREATRFSMDDVISTREASQAE